MHRDTSAQQSLEEDPMKHRRPLSQLTAVLIAAGSLACGAAGAEETASQALSGRDARDARAAINLPGSSFYPEGIAAASDGTFYVGSVGTGAIVRVPPHALGTETFVPARQAFAVYGMVVDEARGTLWACTWDDNLVPAQPSYLTGYSLATGAVTGSFVMPSDVGACNDVTVDAAGNVYASDSFGNAIVKLPLGGTALTPWSTDPAYAPTQEGNFTLNGIALNPQGGLYVVKYDTGDLFSVPILADGSAGAPVKIPVTPALAFPDGLEVIDSNTLLVVEHETHQVVTVKLANGAGTKEVINDTLVLPTNAVIAGGSAWVIESQMDYLFGAPGSPSLPFRVYRLAIP